MGIALRQLCYLDMGCASLSVCHRCLVSFKSHRPGSTGRDTAAVKWHWGFSHCFLAYNFLFDCPGCAGCWLGYRADLQCCGKRSGETQEAKSFLILVSRTLPTVFMTKMKRRNVGASECRGQILLFSTLLLFPDFSEDLTELFIISCLGQWLNTEILTFFCSRQLVNRMA